MENFHGDSAKVLKPITNITMNSTFEDKTPLSRFLPRWNLIFTPLLQSWFDVYCLDAKSLPVPPEVRVERQIEEWVAVGSILWWGQLEQIRVEIHR